VAGVDLEHLFSNSGWGGRLSDQLAALNINSMVPPMISTGGNNLFVTGAASQALVIPTSGSFGLNGFSTAVPMRCDARRSSSCSASIRASI
jgi:hypothetical protein